MKWAFKQTLISPLVHNDLQSFAKPFDTLSSPNIRVFIGINHFPFIDY